jgi:hypothetical protein
MKLQLIPAIRQVIFGPTFTRKALIYYSIYKVGQNERRTKILQGTNENFLCLQKTQEGGKKFLFGPFCKSPPIQDRSQRCVV